LGAARADLTVACQRDPAARNRAEVALFYPGVHALWGYRLSRRLWTGGHRLAARGVSALTQLLTGVDIHPGADLGPGLFIDHASGIVIGETAEVGRDVTIYHGVTLGGTSLARGKRHPTIGDRVTIGAGAKILGPITVGDDSRIGANAVVVKSVPPNSVVVGVPGQVIVRTHPRHSTEADLDNSRLPDVIGLSLQTLISRVDRIEAGIGGPLTPEAHPSAEGMWSEQDFAI